MKTHGLLMFVLLLISFIRYQPSVELFPGESGGTRDNSIPLRLDSSRFSVCSLSRTAVPEASDASFLPEKTFHSNLTICSRE